MGVRVVVGGASVCGPPSMPDTRLTVSERIRLQIIAEHRKLALVLAGVEVAVVGDDGHPGRVIPAIFESLQTAEQYFDAAPVSGVAHNSTHSL
jgi:hypothetical protein